MYSLRRQIFIVHSCDIWKSRDSMRLEMATLSVPHLRHFISEKIKKGDYEYGDEKLSANKQAALFRKDFAEKTASEIDSLLRYATYDYVIDGEEV